MTKEIKAKKERKPATKKQKALGCLAWVITVPLIIVACTTGGDDEKPKETAKPKIEQKAEQPKTKTVKTAKTWEEGIKQIATSKGSKTEKADQAYILAKAFPATNNEQLFDILKELAPEVDNQKYLSKPKDDVYMLTNIYKSAVMINGSTEGTPAHDFAFDFWQNTKYVYRGADTPDSDAVKANEEQMRKALLKMVEIINQQK